MLSVVIVAIPVLAFAMLRHNLQQEEIAGFVFLILLMAALGRFGYSISRKGLAYQWLSRFRPSATVMIDEMIGHTLNKSQLWLALFVSLGIEVIGIVHL